MLVPIRRAISIRAVSISALVRVVIAPVSIRTVIPIIGPFAPIVISGLVILPISIIIVSRAVVAVWAVISAFVLSLTVVRSPFVISFRPITCVVRFSYFVLRVLLVDTWYHILRV